MNEMERKLLGLHHITAITGDPQKNIDFHTNVLGLRLVKVTVNFDDPSAYHLYYGDKIGNPGTVLTYFAWPGIGRGQRGPGQALSVSFSIPENALSFWINHFNLFQVPFRGPFRRFDEEAIIFFSPDGLQMELVAHAEDKRPAGWLEGPIPEDYAIRGMHGVLIGEAGRELTSRFLTETMGFELVAETPETFRFGVGPGGSGTFIDMQESPANPRGMIAVGNIHHVAWRTPSNEEQTGWRKILADRGANITSVIDRHYFRSIYFREPGMVLFEIATDRPGFTIDEPINEMGSGLILPPWLEPNRREIERNLPPLHLKKVDVKS